MGYGLYATSAPLATTHSCTRFNFSQLGSYNLAQFVHDDCESYYRNTNKLATPTGHVLPKTADAARGEKLWDTDRVRCQLHRLRRTQAHFQFFTDSTDALSIGSSATIPLRDRDLSGVSSTRQSKKSKCCRNNNVFNFPFTYVQFFP